MFMICNHGVKLLTMCLICLRHALQHCCKINCYSVLVNWMHIYTLYLYYDPSNGNILWFLLTNSLVTAIQLLKKVLQLSQVSPTLTLLQWNTPCRYWLRLCAFQIWLSKLIVLAGILVYVWFFKKSWKGPTRRTIFRKNMPHGSYHGYVVLRYIRQTSKQTEV